MGRGDDTSQNSSSKMRRYKRNLRDGYLGLVVLLQRADIISMIGSMRGLRYILTEGVYSQ